MSKKLLWALDPFSGLDSIKRKQSQLIRFLLEKEKLSAEAVYVLSPESLNWTGDFSGAWLSNFRPQVEQKMRDQLESLGWSNQHNMKIKILAGKKPSLRSDVKRVLTYAKTQKATYLVLGTHARQGLARMLMGSFAETAMLYSKTPLILMNPESHQVDAVKKLLVPTDLSSGSKKLWLRAIKKAKLWGAELILFHKVPEPIEPAIQSGVTALGGGWVSVQQYLNEQTEKSEKTLKQMVAKAKEAGVMANYEMDQSPGFIVDSICKVAEGKSVSMIVMGSEAGPVSALMLGSVARQVIRQSPVPVWVTHSA